MKISEFIKKLEDYKNDRGDLEMLFSVKDYYSSYGFDAEHNINGNFWENTVSNGSQVRFDISIKEVKSPNETTKYPKVTFRK